MWPCSLTDARFGTQDCLISRCPTKHSVVSSSHSPAIPPDWHGLQLALLDTGVIGTEAARCRRGRMRSAIFGGSEWRLRRALESGIADCHLITTLSSGACVGGRAELWYSM